MRLDGSSTKVASAIICPPPSSPYLASTHRSPLICVQKLRLAWAEASSQARARPDTAGEVITLLGCKYFFIQIFYILSLGRTMGGCGSGVRLLAVLYFDDLVRLRTAASFSSYSLCPLLSLSTEGFLNRDAWWLSSSPGCHSFCLWV